MIGDLILSLPSIFGLTFALIALISKKKTASTKALTLYMIINCIYFFAESNFLRQTTDYLQYILFDVLMISFAMFLPVSVLRYLRSLSNEKGPGPRYIYITFICIGIGLGVASAILYGVMGLDSAEQYISSQIDKKELLSDFDDRIYQIHFLLNNKIFYVAAGIEVSYLLFQSGRFLAQGGISFNKVLSFIRNDRPVRLSVLSIQSFLILIVTSIMAVRICLGRAGLLSHMTLTYGFSIAIAIIVFALNMVAFSSEGNELSRKGVSSPFGQGAINTTQQSTYFPEESFDTLKVKFENAMKIERIFLDPDLTISTMAISMETNRTYLSRLVNMMYKTDFRTYINKLRINYAKELILQEPSASMEYIALKSGYKTLSQFNRKFKEIDGDTPRRWQLMQIGANKGQ